ncbi:hypothetical protein AB0E63_43730 [Kribbella sp. NPDC026596]|uniref:hypothetical protein n=1 Tax=Kribbella sp. NPDC026596 TaxID=3155122 RepID=UPI0033F32785
MTRRPLTTAVVLLSALTALTGCNGSPEAGRPNTNPTSPTPTPTPTAPSTPAWTPEEEAAITAAKARYVAARAAVDKTLSTPTKADRTALEKAGNGGAWMLTVLQDVINYQDYGWYQTGQTKVTNTVVTSVKLNLEQPQVRLVSCVDSSAIVIRFQKDGKPVPLGPGNGRRHKVASQLVYAPPAAGGTKMWWLMTDKASGTC